MLPFFAISSLSYENVCVAPRKTPEPIKNMKPLYAQILTRHGARTPLTNYLPASHRGYWTCDEENSIAPRMHASQRNNYRRFKHVLDPRLVAYLPNCRPGDLLLSGMQQHKLLGEMYGDYFYEIGLFGQYPKDEEIHATCTDIERTLRSAQSFLHGMYPPGEPNTSLTIESGNEEGAVFRPDDKFCKEIKTETQKFESSQEYLKWVDDNWPAIADFAQMAKLTKSGAALTLACDYVTTALCNEKQVPSVITKDTERMCVEVLAYNLYDRYSKSPFLYASYTMREMLRVANQALEGNNTYKFTLNSAHDSTVAIIHQYLAGKENVRPPGTYVIPPYASHLLMEIWEDDNKERYIRFAFNGEILKLPLLNNESLVKYSDFLKSDYMKINDYCKEMP